MLSPWHSQANPPRPGNLLYPSLGFVMLSSTTKVVFPQLVRMLEFSQIDDCWQT